MPRRVTRAERTGRRHTMVTTSSDRTAGTAIAGQDGHGQGSGTDGGDEAAHAVSTGEVAALRVRLRKVEAALGLAGGPGRPAPPSLPMLLRRVATLERRAGIVP